MDSFRVAEQGGGSDSPLLINLEKRRRTRLNLSKKKKKKIKAPSSQAGSREREGLEWRVWKRLKVESGGEVEAVFFAKSASQQLEMHGPPRGSSAFCFNHFSLLLHSTVYFRRVRLIVVVFRDIHYVFTICPSFTQAIALNALCALQFHCQSIHAAIDDHIANGSEDCYASQGYFQVSHCSAVQWQYQMVAMY